MRTTHRIKLACLALVWLPLGAMAGPGEAADSAVQAASGVATKVGKAIEHGVNAAASGVARGMQAAASGVERGVKATASAVNGVTKKVDLSPASAPAKAD
jgi:hypothetical protein